VSATTRKALVFGATSTIAATFCRLLAAQGWSLYLVARNYSALEALASDLQLRGASRVSTALADLCELDQHAQLIAAAWDLFAGFDLALLAHGSLPSQADCENNWDQQLVEIHTNLISQQSLLTGLANRFENQGSGCLAAIVSVAGDRGRASNYIYGAAKAGLSCYLKGLQQRLTPAGVRVIDLRPGWVDTPMTSDFEKGLLWSSPEKVARGMLRATEKASGTVYLPGWWRPIMAVIRILPDFVIRRLGI
jgi:decaprenylphospho-beta-D-erythro-pentofuranosid-2-ulose 2-reductase